LLTHSINHFGCILSLQRKKSEPTHEPGSRK
jgi:hypothetical protein